MDKSRLEAFSDGVIAIILTIMVLELKIPHGNHLSDLFPLIPVFVSYLMSFVVIGIYWNNHHHIFKLVKGVNGPILWSNMNLLFCISLYPFVTGWMGESNFSTIPVAAYAVVEFMAAISYFILTSALIKYHGKESDIAKAIGSDFKGIISAIITIIAIPMAFVNSWISVGLFVVLSTIWIIPDSRVEKVLGLREKSGKF